MSAKQLRYEKVARDPAENQIRWNSLQIAIKKIYDGPMPTAKIVEIARTAFEENRDIEIKLKK